MNEEQGLCQSGLPEECKGDQIKEHSATYTVEKPHKCDICGKKFAIKNQLIYHMRIHTVEKPYKCELCGKGFNCNSLLKYHMMTHTGERPYKCELCGKGFIINALLKYHMMTHTGERPYKCELCGKGFNCNSLLKYHMRIHAVEKPHKCELCQKSFSRSYHLQRHSRTHSGEKTDKCHLCQKSFTCIRNLNQHMEIHTIVIKLQKCELCQKLFALGSAFTALTKDGLGAHTGEKPYKCDLCSNTNAFHNDLNRDLLTHNGDTLCNNKIHDIRFEHSYASVLDGRSHTKKRTYTSEFCHTEVGIVGNQFSHDTSHTGDEQDVEVVEHHRSFFSDIDPFLVKPFGCAICDKKFEIEKEFLDHCYQFCFFPVENDFVALFEDG